MKIIHKIAYSSSCTVNCIIHNHIIYSKITYNPSFVVFLLHVTIEFSHMPAISTIGSFNNFLEILYKFDNLKVHI